MNPPAKPPGEGSADDLVQVLYDQLRGLARERLMGAGQHSLEATGLVHEVWLRMAGAGQTLRFRDEGHFRATAAQAMRWIIVDHARRRLAQRRGGGDRATGIDLDQLPVGGVDQGILDLDAALLELTAEDPRKASVVEMRHFGGLSVEECAAALDVSLATVKRDWQFARAWLQGRIRGGGPGGVGSS